MVRKMPCFSSCHPHLISSPSDRSSVGMYRRSSNEFSVRSATLIWSQWPPFTEAERISRDWHSNTCGLYLEIECHVDPVEDLLRIGPPARGTNSMTRMVGRSRQIPPYFVWLMLWEVCDLSVMLQLLTLGWIQMECRRRWSSWMIVSWHVCTRSAEKNILVKSLLLATMITNISQTFLSITVESFWMLLDSTSWCNNGASLIAVAQGCVRLAQSSSPYSTPISVVVVGINIVCHWCHLLLTFVLEHVLYLLHTLRQLGLAGESASWSTYTQLFLFAWTAGMVNQCKLLWH